MLSYDDDGIMSDAELERALDALQNGDGNGGEAPDIADLLKAMNENRIISWEEAERILGDADDRPVKCSLPPQQRPTEPDNDTNVETSIERLLADDPSLKKLNLNNMKRTPVPQIRRILEAVAYNSNLEHLSLANLGLYDNHVEVLIPVIEMNERLKSLNLETNYLSGDFFARLFRAACKNQTLEEIKCVNQGVSFSTAAEQEIIKAICDNEGLTKVSINMRLPEARNKIERTTMRNMEIRRLLRREAALREKEAALPPQPAPKKEDAKPKQVYAEAAGTSSAGEKPEPSRPRKTVVIPPSGVSIPAVVAAVPRKTLPTAQPEVELPSERENKEKNPDVVEEAPPSVAAILKNIGKMERRAQRDAARSAVPKKEEKAVDKKKIDPAPVQKVPVIKATLDDDRMAAILGRRSPLVPPILDEEKPKTNGTEQISTPKKVSEKKSTDDAKTRRSSSEVDKKSVDSGTGETETSKPKTKKVVKRRPKTAKPSENSSSSTSLLDTSTTSSQGKETSTTIKSTEDVLILSRAPSPSSPASSSRPESSVSHRAPLSRPSSSLASKPPTPTLTPEPAKVLSWRERKAAREAAAAAAAERVVQPSPSPPVPSPSPQPLTDERYLTYMERRRLREAREQEEQRQKKIDDALALKPRKVEESRSSSLTSRETRWASRLNGNGDNNDRPVASDLSAEARHRRTNATKTTTVEDQPPPSKLAPVPAVIVDPSSPLSADVSFTLAPVAAAVTLPTSSSSSSARKIRRRRKTRSPRP